MKYVVVSELNHVAYIKLHRPEMRNAFNPEMIAEITQVFSGLNQRADLRAVALSGEGKAFCAGADLNWMKEMVEYSFEQNQEDSLKLFAMFDAIANCVHPVVGLVHGAVFGGALGLMACCDYVVAEAGTQFCFSEVKLGIAPAVISAFVMKKAVAGKVRPFMLSGVVFTPEQAEDMALVNEVVAVGEGHLAQQRMLHHFLICGPEAVRETKKLLNVLPSLNWEAQKMATSKLIAERRASAEGQEGLKSFLEKRDASWKLK